MNSPDLVFRINEEALHHRTSPDCTRQERNEGSVPGFLCLKSDIQLRKEEEPSARPIDHLGDEMERNNSHFDLGHKAVSLRIKHEDESHSMYHSECKKRKRIRSITGKRTLIGKCHEDSTKCSEKGASYITHLETAQTSEKEKHGLSQQWVGLDPEQRVNETAQFESNFSDQAQMLFLHEPPNVQISENVNDFGSQLLNADLPKHQPKIRRTLSLFACAQCDKTFQKKEYLHGHQITHMGLRPYHCTECGKSFNKKYHLSVHKRTHTGERPFVCTVCDRSFRQSGVLNRHLKTHLYVKILSDLETPSANNIENI